MSNILISNNAYQGTSSACISDLTPPTFAGINFLDVESRGQIRAGWSAASDGTLPIRYEVYIKASTATGLFNTTNIVALTPNLQYDIFTLPDGSFLQNGTTYYVGVRAIDGVSNRDSNLVSMNVISTGVLTSIDTYHSHATYSITNTNTFVLTAWIDKNFSLMVPATDVLGTASYQIYDKTGAAVVGMSGSGISANSEGIFVFPAVSNLLNLSFNHYEIKLTISADGENRTNIIETTPDPVIHQMSGIADVDSTTGSIFGSFWVTEDLKILTSGLGNGSYSVRDAAGNLIPGLSQTGIVPNGNGLYVITPLNPPAPLDPGKAYIVEIEAIVRGESKSNKFVLGDEQVTLQVKSTFAISAANMFQGTLWAHRIEQLADPLILGTASYQVYDKTGAAVVGLSETGIAADVNGFFHITPVSATPLTDLTHYLVKVTIEIGGYPRTAVKGFSLLGT